MYILSTYKVSPYISKAFGIGYLGEEGREGGRGGGGGERGGRGGGGGGYRSLQVHTCSLTSEALLYIRSCRHT